VASYVQDDDGDLPYKLMIISNNDNKRSNDGTAVEGGQPKTNAGPADNSPISDAGTWEVVDHRDTT
jgi:hypothetical protein